MLLRFEIRALQTESRARFGAILSGLVLRVLGTDLHQIWGGYRTVSKIRLVLRYVAAFRNHSASKWTRSKNEFRTFWRYVKIKGRVCEMSWVIFLCDTSQIHFLSVFCVFLSISMILRWVFSYNHFPQLAKCSEVFVRLCCVTNISCQFVHADGLTIRYFPEVCPGLPYWLQTDGQYLSVCQMSCWLLRFWTKCNVCCPISWKINKAQQIYLQYLKDNQKYFIVLAVLKFCTKWTCNRVLLKNRNYAISH